jgi:hypothetical protein
MKLVSDFRYRFRDDRRILKNLSLNDQKGKIMVSPARLEKH